MLLESGDLEATCGDIQLGNPGWCFETQMVLGIELRVSCIKTYAPFSSAISLSFTVEN